MGKGKVRNGGDGRGGKGGTGWQGRGRGWDAGTAGRQVPRAPHWQKTGLYAIVLKPCSVSTASQ